MADRPLRTRLGALFLGPALLLAACSQQEAGAQLELGDFGNSTMHNTAVMTGEIGYAVDLTRRFAAEVPAMVTFAFNSDRLDGAAQAALRQQADFIRQFPEVRFRVYGHTDLVGSAAYNKALGLRRARAVVGFLAQQGIGRDRLEAVVSYGETQPLVLTEGPEQRNRRTVTEVSGFVRSNPLILNGRYAEVIFRDYVASAGWNTPDLRRGNGAATGGGAAPGPAQ